MKISYYLNEGRKKNLYCRITDGSDRVTFSLDHTVDPKKWNTKKDQIDDDDLHYFTLINLKEHLERKYHELKSEGEDKVLPILKSEAELLMDNAGLTGIARRLFDQENKEADIPSYDDFIKAFEKYKGLTADQYKVQTLDSVVHFHAEGKIYEMDTYAGLTARLKHFVDARHYDDLCGTDSQIWNEIYRNRPIKKHDFLPVLLSEWEIYWQEVYSRVKKDVGHTNHWNERKSSSWRSMQVFMECFDSTTDVIDLADRINELEFCPIAIITMVENDNDSCYDEYCGLEFEQEDKWACIDFSADEDDYESPLFYIRQYDF